MTKRVRTIGSVGLSSSTKAREAALCAIKIFNDPLIKFKSESFIVLMIIAWTYLLHAYTARPELTTAIRAHSASAVALTGPKMEQLSTGNWSAA